MIELLEHTHEHRGVSIVEVEKRKKAAMALINELETRVSNDQMDVQAIDSIGEIDSGNPTPSLYLLNKSEGHHDKITNVSFTYDAGSSSGAADSAHAVLSGPLIINDEPPTKVGLKCFQNRDFEDKLARLINECQINENLKSIGYSTIDIRGAIVSPDSGVDGSCVIISKWDSNLITYDNQPWQLGFEELSDNIGIAQGSMSALGKLNSLGIAHKDPKIKNIASFSDGPPVLIDFETSTTFDLTDLIEVESAVKEDIGLLLNSLVKKGFFEEIKASEANLEKYYEAYKIIESLMEHYLHEWLDHPDFDRIVGFAKDAFATSLGDNGSMFRAEAFQSMGP